MWPWILVDDVYTPITHLIMEMGPVMLIHWSLEEVWFKKGVISKQMLPISSDEIAPHDTFVDKSTLVQVMG